VKLAWWLERYLQKRARRLGLQLPEVSWPFTRAYWASGERTPGPGGHRPGRVPVMEQLPPLLLDFEIELAHGRQGQRRVNRLACWRGDVQHDRGYEQEIKLTTALGVGSTRGPICASFAYCLRMRPGA
jgi:hypothetical protein